MITLKDVQCRALHINLNLDKGKYHLVAPNGGGKTTLFKLLTGQLSPDSGSIQLNDIAVNDKACKRQFGFCPDSLNFWPFATVQDYLAVHLRAYGLAALNDDAARLHQQFGLPNIAIEQLSLGQTKQLLILCCVTTPANWLFFDEPLNGLDAQARDVLTQWLEETEKSVLISSHIDLPSFQKVSLAGANSRFVRKHG